MKILILTTGSDQLIYAWGIIICYIISVVLFSAITFKTRNYGWMGLVLFCITLIERNYIVFIAQHMQFSDMVMISNYIGAALCLIASFGLWRIYG